jgi:DNA modification methylase
VTFADDFVTIHHGDAWELAPTLAPQSVHTICTSPPYWGLRDYGEPGQFGLEPTPEAYVARLVELFALLRPALRDDGTVWLNLGDSYAGSGRGAWNVPDDVKVAAGIKETYRPNVRPVGDSARDNAVTKFAGDERTPDGLKPKDLIGIPWRVAFALQADGWYLRSDIIWAKKNCMPESVTDRPTKSHEYIFLLSKSPRYYYDAEAIKEKCDPFRVDYTGGQKNNSADRVKMATRPRDRVIEGDTRNKRDVWTVATQPFAAAHFATFPPDLITPCILAGCPEGGTVLDPFIGSGTTAQVARAAGRKCVGFELNADYIEIAAKHRLAQGVLL